LPDPLDGGETARVKEGSALLSSIDSADSASSSHSAVDNMEDVSRSINLRADADAKVHGTEEGNRKEGGGEEAGPLSKGGPSFSSSKEGSSEAPQSSPSFESSSDSFSGGTSSASSGEGDSDGSSDADSESPPADAALKPVSVGIPAERAPSVSEVAIEPIVPQPVTMIVSSSSNSASAPPLHAAVVADQSGSPPAAEHRLLGLFPLVSDTPLAAAIGPVDPARSESSTTPIRNLIPHRPTESMNSSASSSANTAAPAGPVMATPASSLSSKAPAPGQGWVSPLFGNKTHSSRRFSPYRDGRGASTEPEPGASGAADEESSSDAMVSAVISQLYPELASSIGNIGTNYAVLLCIQPYVMSRCDNMSSERQTLLPKLG
jgi:hypothetical protein